MPCYSQTRQQDRLQVPSPSQPAAFVQGKTEIVQLTLKQHQLHQTQAPPSLQNCPPTSRHTRKRAGGCVNSRVEQSAVGGVPRGKVLDVLQSRFELGPPERSHMNVLISRMICSIFLPASQVHVVPKHQIPHTEFVFRLPPSSFYGSQLDHRMKIFLFFFFLLHLRQSPGMCQRLPRSPEVWDLNQQDIQ